MLSSRCCAALALPLLLVTACSDSSRDTARKGVVTPAPAPKPVATLPAELAKLPASTVYVVTARQGVSYATLAGALDAVAKLPGVVGASIQQGRLQVSVHKGLEATRRDTLLKQLAAIGDVSVPAAVKK